MGMGKAERWGERKPDQRTVMGNWPAYNAGLVRRYDFSADADMVEDWVRQLKEMNEGKNGAPYQYPSCMVQFFGLLRCLMHLPYRGLQGFGAGLMKCGLLPQVPHYSQIQRRMVEMKWNPAKEARNIGEDAIIAADSTGIKVSSFGEWRRVKHHTKRTGFLKLHIIVDTKTKQILGVEVTTDSSHDITPAPGLVEQALQVTSVREFHGDGAYDSYDFYDRLASCGIKPVIPPRETSNPDIEPDSVRSRVVCQYQPDPKYWRRVNHAGIRWMSETAFSVWKTLFGECCSAKKFLNQTAELMMKAWVYNRLRAG